MMDDFNQICGAYRRICESAELDALKHRLDTITPIQTQRSFYDMTTSEKVEAMKESGAVLKKLGCSSRLAMLTNDGTVLKIANDPKGLAQNAAEAYNASEKNRYGCFAKVLWVSRTKFALEMEACEPLWGSEEEFEWITGVNFDKYFRYLAYEKYLAMTPKKRDVVYRASYLQKTALMASNLESMKEEHDEVAEYLRSQSSSDEAVTALKNLAQYLRTHNSSADFSFRDLMSPSNWGKVERNGQEVCIVIDHGASERVLNHMYADMNTTNMQRYERR